MIRCLFHAVGVLPRACAVICLDESPHHLISETKEGFVDSKGIKHVAYEYRREGVVDMDIIDDIGQSIGIEFIDLANYRLIIGSSASPKEERLSKTRLTWFPATESKTSTSEP